MQDREDGKSAAVSKCSVYNYSHVYVCRCAYAMKRVFYLALRPEATETRWPIQRYETKRMERERKRKC